MKARIGGIEVEGTPEEIGRAIEAYNRAIFEAMQPRKDPGIMFR